MHPEHTAMISRLVMEERHREAAARRRGATAAATPDAGIWRARLGGLLVRAGTRLAEPRTLPAARRA